MAPKTFEDAVEASRAAVAAMPNGDPGPTLALWSCGDDVVLANPLGPPIVGFPAVSAETERVAMFVGGGSFAFDEITRVVGGDLGYVVTIERRASATRRERRACAARPPGHNSVPARR